MYHTTDFAEFIDKSIHTRRMAHLNSFELKSMLLKKNPYLLCRQNNLTVTQIVRGFLDEHFYSFETTIGEEALKNFAAHTCKKHHMGWASDLPGIDLEFDKENIRYIVAIKSGPNWGNSRQIAKMKDDFQKAARTLRTSNSGLQVVGVNGCCYGRDDKPDKETYFKYCGQRFWEFISGSDDLYTQIVEPLGHSAKEKNEDFVESYSKAINRFTFEFTKTFCFDNGAIDWDKLVRFNSGKKSVDS